MSGFEVLKAGAFTLIEDFGRYSYMHLGVSNSGFMDEYAALMANKLLDNKFDTNLLEIAFFGLKLKALASTTICITGAKCDFKINKEKKNIWQNHFIKKGDILEIGKIIEGQRVYLGVKGGFKIKKELKSSCVTIKENLGGLDGNKLKNNDFLPYDSSNNFISKRLKKQFIPKYEDFQVLRVLLSYQDDTFTQKQKDKFFDSIYTISGDFNRMACKLNGEKIESNVNGIISEGIAFGAIQIPKDGQPIILLKERQTIGGYPKIGSVLPIDCFKLAQMKPGQKIKFEQIDIKKAEKKIKEFYLALC